LRDIFGRCWREMEQEVIRVVEFGCCVALALVGSLT